MDIKEGLEKILKNYLYEKEKIFKNNQLNQFMIGELPEILYRELQLNRDRYLITGSCGKGNWATIPWIAIFDKTITTSATEGYYIVILFDAKMEGYYLSLNQGYTWYRNNFNNNKETQEKIAFMSKKIRKELGLDETQIDLKTDSSLANGYELGNIYSNYYQNESNQKIKDDIWNMLDLLYKTEQIIGEDWKKYNFNNLNITSKITNTSHENFGEDVLISEEKYDAIINTLLRKKNIILQGVPGVGKTYCAEKLMYSIMKKKDDSRIKKVQFHESYSYEDFVLGYRPDKQGNFKLKEGTFYKLVTDAKRECESAKENNREPEKFCIIIDEINRGNLSKIFGELLMLIEGDKRDEKWKINLTYSDPDLDEQFYVPENLYIIGTMNTADRSLATIDYALKRRFAFIELDPAFENTKFKNYLIENEKVNTKVAEAIVKNFTNLNRYIESSIGKNFRIGHSYFMGQKLNSENYKEIYNNIIQFEIRPLLEDYYLDDESQVEECLKLISKL